MKKCMMVMVLILAFSGLSVESYAASSMTESWGYVGGDIYTLTLSWTAHTDGSFDADTTTVTIKGTVLEVVTDPGSTAPLDNYDITLTTVSHGEDIMGGALANRDTTTTERARPISSNSIDYEPVVNDKLILNITNNTVSAAVGAVIIYYRKRN